MKTTPETTTSKMTTATANKLEDAKEATVTNIINILEDKEIRSSVFRELHAKQRETIVALSRQTAETQNASRLAFRPEALDTSTKEARQSALETIRAEINGIQNEVEANEKAAGKLLCNSVWYAKHMGDRLLFVQEHLLDHGEYEAWLLDDNFNGGVSTARVYTRIAKFQNWKKIAPKLQQGKLTLEAALNLIKKGPAQKETSDLSRSHRIKLMKTKFSNLIKHWEDDVLSDLINNVSFMPGITELMEKTCLGIRRKRSLNYEPCLERLRLLRQFLDGYVKQPDGTLVPRPLHELL